MIATSWLSFAGGGGGGGAGARGESKTGRSGPFHIVCESDLVILKNAFMMRWLAFHAEKKLKSRPQLFKR